MSDNQFSVCQFFEDESYEYVRRVIITDGGDCVAFEWKYGEGIVFPKEAKDEDGK